MKRVQVLLSSYNGQKYIRQQLDTIFNQQGVEVHCLVRDDGSNDNTIDILNEYQKKYVNLEFVKGENIGYERSFMELIAMSGEYDYYAFADQDDVWKSDKLIKAIEQINKVQFNCPIMYCSNCTVVDQDLNQIGMLHNKENIVPSSKIKALVQGFAHGCTIVLNKESRDLLLRYKPRAAYAHDFWIPIILLFLGKVIYDPNSYILYRQHGNNVFGDKRSIHKIIRYGVNQFKNPNFYSNLINEILYGYGDLLKSEDKVVLKEIIKYKDSCYTKMKLLFNKELKKNTLRGTLFLKSLILFSKF